jgi:hypothetical protein
VKFRFLPNKSENFLPTLLAPSPLPLPSGERELRIEWEMELSKQKNYQQSFDLACASIQGMNLEERAKRAGADYQKGGDGEKITISFFSEPYHLQFPQIEFYSPSQKVVSLVTRILLLHYLHADIFPYREMGGL